VRLVGVVFPLQNEPEYNGRECRRVGINLAFNGTKPKRVAESVDQCTNQSRTFYGDKLAQGHAIPILNDKFSSEMGDRPEQE